MFCTFHQGSFLGAFGPGACLEDPCTKANEVLSKSESMEMLPSTVPQVFLGDRCVTVSSQALPSCQGRGERGRIMTSGRVSEVLDPGPSDQS